jgi:tRNA pseudouridine55 synthase
VIVDKPKGWTSHDVVARVRRLARTKRVGHLGTLDPMATGVLPLLIGRATRLAQFFNRDRKVYEGVICFGHSTNTYDAEGTPTSDSVEPSISPEDLDDALDRFRGTIQQVPPPVSAKKVGGTRAYKLARRNENVELPPVEVTIHLLELLNFDGKRASVRVACSAGTYLRSIAHDLGQVFGCGAFLETLRRTASGEFRIEQAHSLERLEGFAVEDQFIQAVIPASELLPVFPNEMVDPVTAGQIRQGRDFRVSPFRVRTGVRYVKAITPEGELVAIAQATFPHTYHPILVFQAVNE